MDPPPTNEDFETSDRQGLKALCFPARESLTTTNNRDGNAAENTEAITVKPLIEFPGAFLLPKTRLLAGFRALD